MENKKVLEVNKISDKSTVLVAGQKNCSVVGKSKEYVTGQDCLDDCNTQPYPKSYVSSFF